MQKNSGWRCCISWHPGAAKLHLPLLPSVSQTNLCFEWNLSCLLKASIKWLFKFLSNVGVENLPCGFGWRDQVRMGLREWVTWTQGEVYSGLRGGALRWPWGHTDSGGRRRVQGDTLPFVRKMYLVRQKCNMVHSVFTNVTWDHEMWICLIPTPAESLPPEDTYLTGLVLMTGVYTQTHVQPLPGAPHIGQLTVEVSLSWWCVQTGVQVQRSNNGTQVQQLVWDV